MHRGLTIYFGEHGGPDMPAQHVGGDLSHPGPGTLNNRHLSQVNAAGRPYARR